MTAKTARGLACAWFGCTLAWAQSATNVNLNVNFSPLTFNAENAFGLSQTGTVGSLGRAALVYTSSTTPLGSDGYQGPVQIGAALYFNELDSIDISYSESDPNFDSPQSFTMSGGTITGGTGAYAGASGSLDLNIDKDAGGNVTWSTATTSGTGSLTVGGQTVPLTLENFRGWCCLFGGPAPPTRQRNSFSGPATASGSLGNGSGTVVAYYYFSPPAAIAGEVTIAFNSSDTLVLWYNYVPPKSQSINPPSSFSGSIIGGTGKYQNATGDLTYTASDGTSFHASGTMTIPPAGPVITRVKTAFGVPEVALNTWLEIHGTNLVPADTPAAGVDWSKAPEFASGMMPTQLGPLSVLFAGVPGYIYFYCSAATNPNCADDQINVLTPNLVLNDPAPQRIVITNNGAPIAATSVMRNGYSPAFFVFDAVGHVAARHLDASLVGPASLYPGLSTPAKAGEIISLYGTGFGPPMGPATIVPGSATQSGSLSPAALSCWISGLPATVAGALVSPGLYQLNLTIPHAAPSGDNPVNCVMAAYGTFPGALIAVQ